MFPWRIGFGTCPSGAVSLLILSSCVTHVLWHPFVGSGVIADDVKRGLHAVLWVLQALLVWMPVLDRSHAPSLLLAER